VSSNTPFGPQDESGRSASGEPEYLLSGPEYLGDDASGSDGEPAGTRKWPVLGTVALGVAAAVGIGGWGAFSMLSGGGAQPAEVIPADAVAYLSLDLDPSASQKIEAFKIMKKFPGLEKELGLNTTDDLRRVFFDEVKQEENCKNLDYDRDIKPWIGERMAVAAVPDAKPGFDVPVFALQVSDQEAAREGIRAFYDCVGSEDSVGFAFSGDYVLVTDTEKRAKAVAASAAEASLADDQAFQDWTDEVGDPGIITMYAGPGAPSYFADMQDDLAEGWTGSEPELMAESEHSQTNEKLNSLYEDFEGMALTVRFDDGAVEAEFAGAGVPSGISSSEGVAGPSLADLPASTGAALSIGLPDGWIDDWFDSMNGFLGSGESTEQMWAEAEKETGLALPEDIETLLGDGLSVSFDADADLEALFDSEDLTKLPVGLRISGDSTEILAVIDKIKAAFGPDADVVLASASDDGVAVGTNPDYVRALVDGGSLGDEASFKEVVPNADEATGALYVNFDAGSGWAEELVDDLAGAGYDEKPDSSARDNVAPLDALGVSTWTDGDLQRGTFRLTTD
jgi:hypothetical protein